MAVDYGKIPMSWAFPKHPTGVTRAVLDCIDAQIFFEWFFGPRKIGARFFFAKVKVICDEEVDLCNSEGDQFVC